jgi:hypothetical protein
MMPFPNLRFSVPLKVTIFALTETPFHNDIIEDFVPKSKLVKFMIPLFMIYRCPSSFDIGTIAIHLSPTKTPPLDNMSV